MASTREGHIEQLQGMLANPEFLARLPDKGAKLRGRLEKLLLDGAPTDDASSSSTVTDAAIAKKSTMAEQQQQPQGRRLISSSVSLSEVMHRTFDHVLPRKEIARLCGEELPKEEEDRDEEEKEALKVSADVADDTGSAGAAVEKKIPAVVSDTAAAAAAAAVNNKKSFNPLQLLSWEETIKAQEDLLEEERTAELQRIRKRMQIFQQ